MEKSCKYCGGKFTATKKTAVYCSNKCAVTAKYGESAVTTIILEEIEATGKPRTLLKGVYDRLKASCEE